MDRILIVATCALFIVGLWFGMADYERWKRDGSEEDQRVSCAASRARLRAVPRGTREHDIATADVRMCDRNGR